MKIQVKNKKTGHLIKNFIISEGGKVYVCSEMGEDVNFDEYRKENQYNDTLWFDEVTDEVEINFLSISATTAILKWIQENNIVPVSGKRGDYWSVQLPEFDTPQIMSCEELIALFFSK